MPHSIRAWIPLRYWPDFCVPCSTLFDIVFKYWDENEWEPGCGDPPSCMIEVLKQDIEDKTITKSDAISIIFALLFGAGDATASSLQSVTLAIASRQEVQDKCYEELEKCNFQPEWSRRFELTPYFLATINEGYRYLPAVYRSMVHTTMEKTKIGELGPYPKDTMVVTNFPGIYFNEKYFPDPFTFKPGRFIDENGNYIKVNHVYPFHFGKRACPGQVTGEIELYYFVMRVLREFKLVQDENKPLLFNDGERNWANSWKILGNSEPEGAFLWQKNNKIKLVPR